jgi:nitroimidazol reductase NimA-like FMN-containing flavoprotein (pyridoxamine 5'-phosphate oxidase superfamily)
MPDVEELRTVVSDLLSKQQLGVLATQHDGESYASLVGFVASDDLRSLAFATMRTTRKFTYLTAAPSVAMLIDNRSHRSEDFFEAIAVTATGQVAEVDVAERRELLERYMARFPHLADFVKSPNCALLEIAVETYFLVTNFQNVMELHIER